MAIGEAIYFARELGRSFRSIGAALPTSSYASSMMATEVARRRGPKRILEVGSGTGAITAQIIKHLGPQDELVLCEINPTFVRYLQARFDNDPAFRAVRDQVTLHGVSVVDLDDSQPFDCIVSSMPFTIFPPDLIEAVLNRFHSLLKPGGTLTYIEYMFMRALKQRLSLGSDRQEKDAANAILNRFIDSYQFRRDVEWRNVPPAEIRHLRLSEAQPEQALDLEPLEYTHEVGYGDVAIADSALPPVAVLSGLALALYRRASKLWLLPFLIAALVAWFLRSPRRNVTPDPDLVYAACDGRVLSVDRLRDPRLGTEEWLRVAVFLSLTDVHINRTPIAGKVIQILREPGGYAPAYDSASEHNVAEYTVLEGARGRCVVAQRVGLVARRIINWSRVGDLLAQGERYGLICLGSRTDVYLPYADVQASVNPGAQVQAGITVIARYR